MPFSYGFIAGLGPFIKLNYFSNGFACFWKAINKIEIVEFPPQHF